MGPGLRRLLAVQVLSGYSKVDTLGSRYTRVNLGVNTAAHLFWRERPDQRLSENGLGQGNQVIFGRLT